MRLMPAIIASRDSARMKSARPVHRSPVLVLMLVSASFCLAAAFVLAAH